MMTLPILIGRILIFNKTFSVVFFFKFTLRLEKLNLMQLNLKAWWIIFKVYNVYFDCPQHTKWLYSNLMFRMISENMLKRKRHLLLLTEIEEKHRFNNFILISLLLQKENTFAHWLFDLLANRFNINIIIYSMERKTTHSASKCHSTNNSQELCV